MNRANFMKKFFKFCAVTALFLVLVGLGFAAAGGALTNTEQIREVVDRVTGGRIHLDLTEQGREWQNEAAAGKLQNSLGNVLDRIDGDVHYDIEDATMFDEKHPIVKDDFEGTYPAEAIRNLEVELGGCSFTVEESGDDDYHVAASGFNKLQCYVEEGTLYVRATVKTVVDTKESGNIVLYVPVDAALLDFDMEVGAGIMNLGRVKAQSVELEVGAGQILAESVTAGELDISVGMGAAHLYGMRVAELNADVGMGNLYAKGAVTGSGDLECSMGNITLELSGAAADYDYSIKCGAGNVEIGQESYSGLLQEKEINNGTGHPMEVECAMGKITISFED